MMSKEYAIGYVFGLRCWLRLNMGFNYYDCKTGWAGWCGTWSARV